MYIRFTNKIMSGICNTNKLLSIWGANRINRRRHWEKGKGRDAWQEKTHAQHPMSRLNTALIFCMHVVRTDLFHKTIPKPLIIFHVSQKRMEGWKNALHDVYFIVLKCEHIRLSTCTNFDASLPHVHYYRNAKFLFSQKTAICLLKYVIIIR